MAKLGVISAFEMACWDIVGKALNQPIYNLLGGQYHEKLRSYTYLYPAADDPVQGGGSTLRGIVPGDEESGGQEFRRFDGDSFGQFGGVTFDAS